MDASQNAGAATSTELAIGGMTCANCARHVTEAIQGVPGVAAANVRLQEGRAAVRWTGNPDLAGVMAAVKKAGYEARPLSGQGEKKTGAKWSPLSGWQFNVVIG